MAGRFIVFEGGDGAGKGTALAALDVHLRAAGIPTLVTAEPGGTPEGLALRALLLAQAGAVWDGRAELLLMMAARIQHVRRVILPALAQGTTVLCDRFVGSTLAYQGGGRGLPEALIRGLHRDLLDDLRPDLTLLLDVDPAVGLARSRARLAHDPTVDEGRFEGLQLAFHQRVRTAYLAQANDPGWRVIDASRDAATVAADVAAAVAATP